MVYVTRQGIGYKFWSFTHPHKGGKIYGKAQAEEATESKGGHFAKLK